MKLIIGAEKWIEHVQGGPHKGSPFGGVYQPHQSPVTEKKELAYHERPEYIGEKMLTTKIGPIKVSVMVFLSWAGGRKTPPTPKKSKAQ